MRGAQDAGGPSARDGPMNAGLAPVKRKGGWIEGGKGPRRDAPAGTIYIMRWTRAAR